MPAGGDPPDPALPQAVFTALHSMTYDAAAMAFKSGADLYFLFVERKPGGSVDQGRWFYGKDSEGGKSPKGQIPQITYDVVHGGTYNPTTGKIAYGGHNYFLWLMRETSSGKQLAQAHVV